MAKHASVLRQFEISTVQYDGGIEIEHCFKECDWSEWIAGVRLTDLMKQATAHAKVCDGKPQPRPEPVPRPPSPFTDLWAPVIAAALEIRIPSGQPTIGLEDQLLMADPVHIDVARD